MKLDRTLLLNLLFHYHGFESYLEIGVHEGLNYALVNAPDKESVDPNYHATHRMTSDEFFEGNTKDYDVVFIDGLHEEEQVMRDIGNALDCLNEGGCIVLHDCLPESEWHQRDASEFQEGEAWNGTVWKAVLRYFNTSEYYCRIIDEDNGLGIIDTSRRQKPRKKRLAKSLDFRKDFDKLAAYLLTKQQFYRELFGVKVVYHIGCMGNWQEVVKEQLATFKAAGLDELHLSIASYDEAKFEEARKLVDDAGIQVAMVNTDRLKEFEKPAMELIEILRENCDMLMYFHTKGVSSGEAWKDKWRRLMMREVVSDWMWNCHLLIEHDAVGVNWRHMPPISHFSGNFWMARTDYLKVLPDFKEYYANPQYHFEGEDGYRLGCEFWIGAADPNAFSRFCTDEDFVVPSYWDRVQI